ncbi:hypothetical protein J2X19_001876 [Rhodoferax ferrireducens]|uniref:DUF4435 domain-containing protein n=1 Tax=Rhodoferax ferrireducens TaxID=192843 RepID=A0ABU2C790_9BURK|nr:DUF4435 domain-containing protein [Rhodoferax ferrireducens]MDR7377197.1 hypothetical protein [Rhodoferax ferrireducens]
MSFTRSQSGIRNTSLFFGVDRTVYVEGTGVDQRFWQSVFSVFYKGPLSFHFKSIGPRSAVMSYVEKIAKSEAANTIAIMDSDYEGLKFSKFDIPNIIYTFGYSFENDLFSIKQAIKISSQLSNGVGIKKFRSIVRSLNTALNELPQLAVLDFCAQFNDNYFLEKNGNTCKLDIKNNAHGVICKKSIASARANAIARKVLFSSRPSKAMRDKMLIKPRYLWIYGHLWRAVFSKCVADGLRKTSSVTINPDGIENLAINNIRDSNGSVFTRRQIEAYKMMLTNLI